METNELTQTMNGTAQATVHRKDVMQFQRTENEEKKDWNTDQH